MSIGCRASPASDRAHSALGCPGLAAAAIQRDRARPRSRQVSRTPCLRLFGGSLGDEARSIHRCDRWKCSSVAMVHSIATARTSCTHHFACASRSLRVLTDGCRACGLKTSHLDPALRSAPSHHGAHVTHEPSQLIDTRWTDALLGRRRGRRRRRRIDSVWGLGWRSWPLAESLCAARACSCA